MSTSPLPPSKNKLYDLTSTTIGRYVAVGIVFSIIIFFFSMFMTGLAHTSNNISCFSANFVYASGSF